jgi:assimilatory nitrate reductase catalytic subunit
MSLEVQTTCPYCGVGCGILATIDEAGSVSVKGDPAHPANYGRLCSKGAALGDTIGMEGRMLYPEIEGTAHSWDNALKYTADRFNQIIEEHGRESIAFYVSGQLLTEDYYVANKLMKGFIGTANIDTNSRLCMSSAVAAHKRAFGSDTVPCSYEDLERAKLIVLVGSNTAWCHPVLYQRIVAAKKSNPDLMIVVIDPRETSTCDVADTHLAIKPGTDHILFNGLLLYLHTHDERNSLFVNNHTEGLDDALNEARDNAADINMVAEKCNLTTEQVDEFYRLFSRTERVVSVFSQGMNQWSYGTDKINSLINCHLITGRIGRTGMGPFSFTGQPNAMGGREVGGLANQLAAHMALDNEHHREVVQSFWQSPYIANKEGLKAVELFDAIHDGEIKALWIMATNPAVSLPNSNKVRTALEKLEFLAVSDCIRNTDTTRYAHVLFPAQTWGERDGSVTNTERRISRQRAFLPTPGQVRPDWWIISQIARHMGFEAAFDYQSPADVFREHATLSSQGIDNKRDFNISALAGISEEEYDKLLPIQWPVTSTSSSGTARMFTDGSFFTESGKAQFIPIADHHPANNVSSEYPLILNTGRVRDHWHTMTRTGKSARLSGHIYEPYIELHEDDAEKFNINQAELVQVTSHWGNVVVRAKIGKTTVKGAVFIPIHWNDQYASNAIVDKVVNPVIDSISGQPEFKHTPVNISPYAVGWYGFVLSRRQLPMVNADYWVNARGKGIWRYEMAGQEAPGNWAECARSLLCQHAENVEWIEFHDKGKNRYRAARIENGRLESCIFIGPDIHLPERDWLQKLFIDEALSEKERTSILTGKPPGGQVDIGRIVCSCFGVGVNVLLNTIRDQNLTTVESVGKALRAGTNCGSCIPELREIIRKNSA